MTGLVLLGVYIFGLLLGILWAGYRYELQGEDEVTWVILAILWPGILAVLVALSPFIGVYLLGQKIGAKRAEQIREKILLERNQRLTVTGQEAPK